jgi:GAF domain-containing protein
MLDKSSLSALTTIADTLTDPHDLENALNMITTVTCELMNTGQAGILLRDNENHQLIVKAVKSASRTGVKQGKPLKVPPRLHGILWKVKTTHRINDIESGVQGLKFPILCTPLKIKGEVIGLLITGDPTDDGKAFGPNQRKLYKVLATFASLAIERAKAYDYLHNQFAQRAHDMLKESEGAEDAQDLMIASVTNPDKVIRLLASSFYKELDRAGFESTHITIAASQILDCMLGKCQDQD